MNPSARIKAVLELLTTATATPRPADAVVSAYFRQRRYIGSKDRAYISDRFYQILRHEARLNWWIAKFGLPEDAHLRLLAWLRMGEKLSPEEIAVLHSGGKFALPQLVPEQHQFLVKLNGRTFEHPQMPEEVAVECPEFASAALKEKFGKNFGAEMAAMLQPATLDLRINPLKIGRDEALAALQAAGLSVELGKISPLCLRLPQRVDLNRIPMLKNGQIEIQDEGSQLVALATAARPGMRVVDFCAGAGGKTLVIAALMQNKGRIFACDVLGKRLERSTERFRRADIHNIETKVLESKKDPWVKKHKNSFDCVLVDAPCSGTGTWRRNPDQRYRQLGPGLEALLPLQASILESACRLVKAGGRLVYATCSLLPDENENQIENFLKEHPEFSLVPFAEALDQTLAIKGCEKYLSLSPHQHGTDGFFAAVMQKTAASTVAGSDEVVGNVAASNEKPGDETTEEKTF